MEHRRIVIHRIRIGFVDFCSLLLFSYAKHSPIFRWSNPVLDRLTGGTGHIQPPPILNQRPLGQQNVLRNESYYMATNDTWSPSIMMNGNSSVLIEEDPEPMSP